jgi:hypothetical protein
MNDTRASKAPDLGNTIPERVTPTMTRLMDDLESYGFKAHGSGLRSHKSWRMLRQMAQVCDKAMAAAAKASGEAWH